MQGESAAGDPTPGSRTRPHFDPPFVFITPSADDRTADTVEAALRGGLRAVQLRDPRADGGSLFQVAARLRRATERRDALLIVNDRIDVALAIDADGVHLPARGFDTATARRLIGPDRLLGRSVHSIDEIERLAGPPAGVDYVQFGPVFDTPSKRPYGPPQGVDALAAAARAAHAAGIATVAVGGIDGPRIDETFAAAADAVAVIRALSGAADPAAAAETLADAVRRATH